MKNKFKAMKLNKKFIMKIIIFLILSLIVFLGYILIKNLCNNNSYKKIYDVSINKKELNIIKENLNIQEIDYKWNGVLISGNNPKKIVIHHAATENLSPQEVHEMHVSKGWIGIGYHFYIRSDGTIFKGRNENKIGSHVYGNNTDTLGICLEGNFEEKGVPREQLEALVNLATYLTLKYDISDIVRHNDLGVTECPGKLFPFESIKNSIIEKIKNIN